MARKTTNPEAAERAKPAVLFRLTPAEMRRFTAVRKRRNLLANTEAARQLILERIEQIESELSARGGA